jgi:hypothetical protein
MKKWLNINAVGDDFSSDELSADEHEDTETDNDSDAECEPPGKEVHQS